MLYELVSRPHSSALSSLQAQNMNKSKQKKSFYIDSSSWRVPALYALIVSTLSVTLNFHFYYLHYYLIAASLISLIISYQKYATLTDSSITLFTGLFGKKISIGFDQINLVEPETREVKSFARVGPVGAVPYNFEIDYISINLLKPLAKHDQDRINRKKGKNVFFRKMEVTQDGSSIVLYKPPRGGFRPFLDSLSSSVKVLKAEEILYNSKFSDIKAAIISVSLFAGYILLAFFAIYKK